MAERKSYVFAPDQMEGIPVICYEGTVTRGDVELPDGSIQSDVITARSEGLKKGDLVKFYSDSSNPGVIIVQKVTLGSNEVNDAVGVLADNPLGNDNTTATGQTPAFAQRRVASMKAFFHRIEEFDVTSAGAIRANYSVLFSEAAEGVIEGSSTLANGNMIAAAYTAASGIVPCAMGYYGFHPGD